jgi:16S rRNA (guanine966-N2)-methyltransferase
MRVQLRIVAGALRGRKVTCHVSPDLRPTPQMVREALFSILGNAVPDRPFVDIFAGTGIIGMEALSRGARSALFVERDFPLAGEIQKNLKAFGIADAAQVARTDAYRWVRIWAPPAEPANVFLSPPFPDLQRRTDEFLGLVRVLQQKVSEGSVIVIQAEKHSIFDQLPDRQAWEERRYGRNVLLVWQRPSREA